MSKELWMAAHEQLVEEYMIEHQEATWEEAYEKTADRASERLADNLADLADAGKDRRKYNG